MTIPSEKSPERVIRWIVLGLIAAGLLCFFLPFVTLSLNDSPSDAYAVLRASLLEWLNGGEIAPRRLSGFQLIFAFASGETINEHLEIGPLPCNVYVLCAFLVSLAAAVLALVAQFRPSLGRLTLLTSALCPLVSFGLLLAGRIRMVAYYTAHTANGGEQFGHWFEAGFLRLTTEPWLAVGMTCFFLASMAAVMLAAMPKGPLPSAD